MAHLLSQDVAVLGGIDPVSQGVGSANGSVIDLANVERVQFVLSIGAMTALSTVDYGIYGDSASGGAFATLITGKSVTQLLAAGGNNRRVVINVDAGHAIAQGFRYLREKVTVAGAASIVSSVALGGSARYQPGSDYDHASVVQIVA